MVNFVSNKNIYPSIEEEKDNENPAKRYKNDPLNLFQKILDLNAQGQIPEETLVRTAVTALCQINCVELNKPEVRKVERVLRNLNFLHPSSDPNFVLKGNEGVLAEAHKSILALESPYFELMKGFTEFENKALQIETMGIAPEVYRLAVAYLYASDTDRKNWLLTVDRALLIDLARLADFWKIDELKMQCDEELCNSLDQFSIEKNEEQVWEAYTFFAPRFARLLKVITREAGSDTLESIISKMQTPEGAAWLASKCTQEEIVLFSTLKSLFGEACRLPLGAFGKEEWEKTFPVTIMEVPPLPPGIHALLEQQDPSEKNKKLKETCILFLRPKQVIFHGETGDKTLVLTLNGIEQLAEKARDSSRRMECFVSGDLRHHINAIQPPESGWVLMRRELIPGTGWGLFENQKKILNKCFEVPKLREAMLLYVITQASAAPVDGKCLVEVSTFCQEKMGNRLTVVGGTRDKELYPGFYRATLENCGIVGTWKF